MTSRHRGFTLLEILLVVLVLGICTAAFAPVALQSVEAARTRSALRNIISLHHYGRTRSMRGQETLVITYDALNGRVSLNSSRSLENEDQTTPPPPERWMPGPTDQFDPENSAVVRSISLPAELRIEATEGMQETGSVSYITYRSNGSTPTFRVELVDSRGDRYELLIEGTSGHVDILPHI